MKMKTLVTGLLVLSACSGQVTGGLSTAQGIAGQIPGVLNIPTSVCVSTISQEIQSLGELKALILGRTPPIAP